jgi:hypothetical protein
LNFELPLDVGEGFVLTRRGEDEFLWVGLAAAIFGCDEDL